MKMFLEDKLFYFLRVGQSVTQHLLNVPLGEKSTSRKWKTQLSLSKNLLCKERDRKKKKKKMSAKIDT